MMYSESKQSIEQICVCRIDEMIKPLTTAEGIRETALRPGQWKPETDPEGGVYMDASNGLMSTPTAPKFKKRPFNNNPSTWQR